MSGNFFLDTNILVYSFDNTAPAKQAKAKKLIEQALLTGKGIISFQVLQEFINFALKTKTHPMNLEQANRFYSKVLRPLCSVHSSFALYQHALEIKAQTKFGWYDSLIVASAQQGNCNVLYSEDLQDGRKIASLSIENPFN